MIVFSNPTRSEAPECLAVHFRFMQSSIVQHSDWLTQLNLRLLDSNDPYSVSQPSPSVVLKAYKDSALLFSARVWTQNEHYWDTLNDLYEIIFLDLHANGIDIPFNRLDVALLPSPEAEGADGKGARKAAVAVRGMNENTREDKKK